MSTNNQYSGTCEVSPKLIKSGKLFHKLSILLRLLLYEREQYSQLYSFKLNNLREYQARCISYDWWTLCTKSDQWILFAVHHIFSLTALQMLRIVCLGILEEYFIMTVLFFIMFIHECTTSIFCLYIFV